MTWGDVAIGCRIAKHPEAAFFASWTGLIVQGMRSNDLVLAPSMHAPAHWAADHLASQFLKSDCDSLLMIDDDMSFEPDVLERMRSNPANNRYDIIFAFCTTREIPPKPVMKRLVSPSPERYDYITRFVDGETVDVDLVGLAFTLIRRHVFERMIQNGSKDGYFFTYGYGRETDDVPFSRRCRGFGCRMGVDTSVKIDHVGAIPIGWKHLQKQRSST